jgi:hypothetical protein
LRENVAPVKLQREKVITPAKVFGTVIAPLTSHASKKYDPDAPAEIVIPPSTPRVVK